MLREEIRLIADQADYKSLAAGAGSRHETGFLYIRGPDAVAEGKIDLVSRDAGGVVLLDIKTFQGDAETARLRAEDYAVQRDLYVAAAEAIGGEPVSRFAFQFSRAKVQVSAPVTAEGRAEAERRLDDLFSRIGRGTPTLTKHPEECRYCGYKKVGWCPGVASTE